MGAPFSLDGSVVSSAPRKMQLMVLTYPSGEPVLKGDRIRYADKPGFVEFVADAADLETAWYVEEFGGGCMINAEGFGSVFLDSTSDQEDLEFVSRATA
jgi:hypothetical protein